ncbi:MAG: metal ABC transporter substrate-binding protein [Chloroflexi bacterium]|jgi:zinc/manganese transport system substrate-binding protein|nr:metal ABC transporter substrate-binding protein [Chloroflexota bacterium]
MRLRIVSIVAAGALAVAACGGAASPTPGVPAVVVTTTVIGTVVADLVGDRAGVTVLMGNGVDPHDWSPSAKDIERVMKADVVVANGLGLEEGLEKTLDEAEKAGVAVFRATDHITVREVSDGEHGGEDPHFWVDPISMQDVVAALVPELARVGVDVADRGADLETRLTDLDAETRASLAVVPDASRKLVTGHESMGYFADRYAFELIGTVIPGLSSQGEVSAGELAALKAEIDEQGVKAIFTEIGTPTAVVEAIGQETGVEVVELPSHTLPDDGSYFSFIRQIGTGVADALR